MEGSLRQRLTDSLRSFRGVFANRDLLRLELAWAGSNIGGWAYSVAVAVYAYDADGATAVGFVAFIRMAASAVAAPILSVLADRYRRRLVMVASDLVRVAALGGAAVVALADGPPTIVYALTVVVAISSTAFRPAQAAITPSLARGPEELASANVASSTIESLGIFAGPALGGLLLAVSSPGTVFAATALAFLWSALLVARIGGEDSEREQAERGDESFARAVLVGATTIGGEAPLRVLVGLYSAQCFVSGMLNVLLVVAALQLLGLGEGGVGYLTSAVGVGGIVGAFVTLVLVGRSRLAGVFGLGILLWGVPIALIGAWPNDAAALALLAVVGVGNTIVDVTALTLLQRAVPDEVLARVFGILESLVLLAIAIGSVLASTLVSAIGIRGALGVAGAILPVLALLAWRQLSAVDTAAAVPAREIALLRGVPFLAGLPTPTLERLAVSLIPIRLPARTAVFHEGDPGDRFYVLAVGTVDVETDGKRLATFQPGYYFGEIALLHDVPRTATITTMSDVDLFALDRDEFLAAVTGHAPTAEEADAVVSTRLRALRAGVASL